MWRGEQHPLEGVGAAEVKEEETLEINGANEFGHFVCDGSQRKGKEERGGGSSDIIQVV